MERIFAGILVIAILVVAAFAWIDEDPAPETLSTRVTGQALELDSRIDALEMELALALARLADIERVLPEPGQAPAPALAELPADPDEEGAGEEEVESEPERTARDERALSRIERSGLTEEEFDALESRAYELYLENFEQEWLRRRESYLASERLPTSRERLRDELGDDGYDRYLFANGSPNRVRVRRVMPGSAAQLAGLQDGDLILGYDGRRLFDFEDLRRASYEGEPGETVLVDVRRDDGTVLQLSVPRGPMGISSRGGGREAPGGG